MLIHRMRVAGLLSFGPDGVDLPLEPLNVLIGPNGSDLCRGWFVQGVEQIPNGHGTIRASAPRTTTSRFMPFLGHAAAGLIAAWW